MSTTNRKLEKFIKRFNKGDFGYCTHRLRKFNRRRDEALEALAYAVAELPQREESFDERAALVAEILENKDALLNSGKVSFMDLAEAVFSSGRTGERERIVEETPEELLERVIGLAVCHTDDGTAAKTLDRYYEAEKRWGLSNVISKFKHLYETGLPNLSDEIGLTAALNSARKYLEEKLPQEVFEDYLAVFKGAQPAESRLADDFAFRNEFGEEQFSSAEEFQNWVGKLRNDRGPFRIELTTAGDILNEDAELNWDEKWLTSEVAVVRDGGESDAVLFVLLIGQDVSDAEIHKLWLSTDANLWNLNFGKEKEDTVTVAARFSIDPEAAAEAGEQCRGIRPDDPDRPTRASELAEKIHEWAVAPTDKCFRQAVWAVGVEALFGKSIFVPSEFAEDGAVKAIGPVGPDGQRFYVCYIDCPRNGKMHTEMKLAAFLRVVLDDGKAIGVAFKATESKLLVRRDTLEELACKVGPDLTGGGEDENATKD